jgi:bile acid:Na+ symporter, BASS family
MGLLVEILPILLKLSIVIFMVGSLLDMGLRLNLQEALVALRNVRFVVLSMLCGFVLCPALAYLLTKVIPLHQSYAVGMLLLGMTPCAPFLPMMVDKAHGDMAYAAAFMLLASLVTVVYMPLAVPVMIEGLTADAWTIAKPLLLFLIVPLAVGLAIQRISANVAVRLQPIVKKTTVIDMIVMLVLCAAIFGKDFINAAGSYAFGTQILFFLMATTATHALGFGLPQAQKSVLTLGISTRNLGAALVPLFAIPDVDQRAIIMVAIGIPMQTIASLLAAHWFARHAEIGEPGLAQKGDPT